MKVKYLIVIIMLIVTTSTVIAENIIVDTRLGRVGDYVTYRVSRIDYLLTKDISGRIIYSVLDGMGITGNLNNLRIGLQGVYKIKLMDNKLLLDLAVGGSYSSSDEISGSISADLGLDANISCLTGCYLLLEQILRSIAIHILWIIMEGYQFPCLIDFIGFVVFCNANK